MVSYASHVLPLHLGVDNDSPYYGNMSNGQWQPAVYAIGCGAVKLLPNPNHMGNAWVPA